MAVDDILHVIQNTDLYRDIDIFSIFFKLSDSGLLVYAGPGLRETRVY